MKKSSKYLTHISSYKLLFWIGAAIGLFPMLFIMLYLYNAHQKITYLEEKYKNIILLAQQSLQKRKAYLAFSQKYKNIDPYYLNRHVEPLIFCQKEKDLLQYLLKHPGFCKTQDLQTRLHFLQKNNTIKFIENTVDPHHKEREEKLSHPIEVTLNDIKILLSYIEGVSIKTITPPTTRPLLFFKYFSLKKGPSPLNNDTFFVNMQLINKDIP